MINKYNKFRFKGIFGRFFTLLVYFPVLVTIKKKISKYRVNRRNVLKERTFLLYKIKGDGMKKLTSENREDFLEYYHGLHDSSIKEMHVDLQNAKIELEIDVFWSGKPTLKKEGTYETNKTKIHLVFKHIHQFFYKELTAYDYIEDAYINDVKVDGEKFICFATDKDEPQIYIICKEIEYEDIKEDGQI